MSQPDMVTLTIEADKYAWRVFSGKALIAQHTMIRTAHGFRSAGDGSSFNKLDDALTDAIDDNSPYDIVKYLESL